MKVKELIQELSQMDQEADITVNTYEGCHGLGNVYQIQGVDFWPANEKYKTPASAFLEVGDGCFCDGHRGSKIKKLGLGPQNISQFFLGLDEAEKVILDKIKWYDEALAKLAKPQDFDEKMEKDRYGQTKRTLENALRDIGKLKNRGQKETP